MTAELGQWITVFLPPENPDSKISVLYGDGTRGFTQQVVFAGQGDLEGQLADIDNDGDLDIVAKPFRHNIPRVDIYLNQGDAPAVVVPEVVGLSQTQAEADLLAEGLTVGSVTYLYSEAVPVGDVILQKPLAGNSAIDGWPIDLFMSGGIGDYYQDFESYADGDNPADWLDTAANNSMAGIDSLFYVIDVGTDKAFGPHRQPPTFIPIWRIYPSTHWPATNLPAG